MAAGRQPSRRRVSRSPAITHSLVRTSRSHHPPSLRLRKTSVPTGPVSHRTTTAIVRLSRRRMYRIIRINRRFPTTPDNRRPMCKTIRTGRRPPITRGNRRAMCKIILTNPLLPITPVSSRKAISRGIRPQTTPGISPTTIVRLALGRIPQTPLPL